MLLYTCTVCLVSVKFYVWKASYPRYWNPSRHRRTEKPAALVLMRVNDHSLDVNCIISSGFPPHVVSADTWSCVIREESDLPWNDEATYRSNGIGMHICLQQLWGSDLGEDNGHARAKPRVYRVGGDVLVASRVLDIVSVASQVVWMLCISCVPNSQSQAWRVASRG
jgi:hypothetical protein